jgi:serine/threonine protein kinase
VPCLCHGWYPLTEILVPNEIVTDIAHQKTIIHPDTKPGNVLVTDAESQPTPNGVDFEVARATEFTLARNSLADPGLSQNCRVQLEREWKGF